MSMRLPNLKRKHKNYTAIALSRVNMLPSGLKEELKKARLFGDIVAAAGEGAVEGYVKNYDVRETKNAANRAIYKCLRGLGYRRERGSSTYSDSEQACEPQNLEHFSEW